MWKKKLGSITSGFRKEMLCSVGRDEGEGETERERETDASARRERAKTEQT